MVNHPLWHNVDISVYGSVRFVLQWNPLDVQVMRYADVIVDGDPVISAFRLLFHHQKSRLRFIILFIANQSHF